MPRRNLKTPKLLINTQSLFNIESMNPGGVCAFLIFQIPLHLEKTASEVFRYIVDHC